MTALLVLLYLLTVGWVLALCRVAARADRMDAAMRRHPAGKQRTEAERSDAENRAIWRDGGAL